LVAATTVRLDIALPRQCPSRAAYRWSAAELPEGVTLTDQAFGVSVMAAFGSSPK
jgi:hypothetical protein